MHLPALQSQCQVWVVVKENVLHLGGGGGKNYELTNHLGNVLVTISDKKIGVDQNSDGTIDYYKADVVTASDYAPFGMQISGRKFSSLRYRYGFNGKENDNEVKGEGNEQDYGMRIYDGRLGRFLSLDPLTYNYPELTPYQFASNRTVDGVDLDGMEYLNFNQAKSKFSTVYLKVSNEGSISLQGAQGSLNLINCSGWLRDYCTAYNENEDNWHDENGNKTIGTNVTLLGEYMQKVSLIDEDVSRLTEQKNLDIYAQSPKSQYGRGTVPNIPSATDVGKVSTTSSGGGKIGGAIAAATFIAKAYSKVKTHLMNEEISDANQEFKDNGWRVLTRLQFAIDKNKIPKNYLNQKALTQIANYFMYGGKINDSKLDDLARNLWNYTDQIYYYETQKRVIMHGDGNGGNTGVSTKPRKVELKVKKKV